MTSQSPSAQTEEPSEWAGLVSLFALVRAFPVRILAITALMAVGGYVLASSQERQHESSILVGLEDWQSRNPVVEGLGIPVGTKDTRDAYSILRSQDVLSLVVSGRDQGSEGFRQGLTTWVEEDSSFDFLGSGESTTEQGRGFLQGVLLAPVKTTLTLRFKSHNQVQIVRGSSKLGVFLESIAFGSNTPSVEFRPGEAFVFEEYGLELTPHGDLTGRTFVMQRLTENQAVGRLRSSISLQVPTERSGVVRATVRSSQSSFAKRLATAISGAFMHHEDSRMSSQAEGVVKYIGAELTLRQEELGRLDNVIAEAQNNNPDLVDPVVTLDQLRGLQREFLTQNRQDSRRKLELQQIIAGEPLEDRSLVTLRRVAENPQVGRWLDRIDELQNLVQGSQLPEESALLHNQMEQLNASAIEVRTSRRYSELFDKRLSAFLDGEPNSLAALLDDNGRNLVQSKPIIELAVRPFRDAQARLASSLDVYTDKHPEVVAGKADLKEKRQRLVAALRALSSTLQENHERALVSLETLKQQVDKVPGDAQAQWSTGQAALWEKVRAALTAQYAHLETITARQASELAILSNRIQRIPFDQSALESPLVKRRALGSKIDQLLAKKEDAEVALAGLEPSTYVLEPATNAKLRQPNLNRLGLLVGTLLGLLTSLASAQFSSRRRPQISSQENGLSAQLPHVDLPVLSRMIRACADDNFGAAHPMRPNTNGPAFAALRRLRVQLNLLAERKLNTSLLGITSLVAELNEFGTEEEPSLCHQTNDPREGSSFHTPSLVTSTIGALGISQALAHKRVLLVDANIFGNSLTAHLDLIGNSGLTDCLVGESLWQTSVVTIGPSNVDVLPLGQTVGEGDEMLAHPSLGLILKELGHHYDVVLVELPGVDESPNLPRLTNKLGSILVVENARTPLDAVECARLLGPLRRSGTRLVGTFVALRGILESTARAA